MIKFKTTENIEFGKTLFLIPSYQRGYRWQGEDVKKLLKDLMTFTGSDYCLQPLELQKTTRPKSLQTDDYENYIRVVDGQQRLTTLSIIASQQNIQLGWDIYYLKEGKFLSKLLQDDVNEATINAHFRHEVEIEVENFAEKGDIAKYFDSVANIVFPIHFLPDDNGETEEADKGQNAFNRLNAGKTPLTSSELIRALYMVHDSGLDEQQHMEISKEWELIENTLSNEQFWLMFDAVGLEKTPTRIDLLFALVLNIDLHETKNNPRIIYETLESGYYERKYDLNKVWGAVLNCFWWMQSCYEDIECFNYLCWLVMCTDNQASTVYHDHQLYPVMEDFKKALVKKILDNGVCDIQMRYGNPKLKNLLLLCNVLECNNGKERLHFEPLNTYDIEHIDSQTPNDLSNTDARREWLGSVFDEYKNLRNEKSREEFCSQENIKELINQVKELNGENAIKDGDGLGNLVLLDSKNNRSYKNAVFPAKRKVIRSAIEKGEQYILPCTAKAFMKYYTENASQIGSWLQQDFDGYQNAMNALIRKFVSQTIELTASPISYNFGAEPKVSILPSVQKSISKTMDQPLQGEVSFEQLMNTYKIRIPKIQRLYVQGRKDAYGNKCLSNFANILVDSVCNGSDCPLDMIYGIADDTVFYPLDGQQRLTTLLLLFWLCGKTKNAYGEKWKFVYESRRSTELFINFLLDTLSPLNKPDYSGKCSGYVASQPWFIPVWKHDPGIAGMLNMLDSLLEKLLKFKKPFEKLSFDKITFSINYLDVAAKEYDHIFLKMNSRGRQLTAWENVKAVIDKFVPANHQSWKTDVDLTWPERIWSLVNKNINTLDGNLLEIIQEALKYAGYDGKAEDTFHLGNWMEENADDVEKFFTCAEMLLSATEINDNLRNALKPSWENTPLMPNFGKIDSLCKKHLAIYYAAQKSTNTDWMRVVWNIVENSNTGDNLPGALKLIDEMAGHCDGILYYLGSEAKIDSQFGHEQLQEERKKARLICSDNTWYDNFKEAEAYPFIKGRVSVILKAAENEKFAFSKIVSICSQMLQKQKDMIEFFKSYLPYAQECDLPLTYDKEFYDPQKWKQMFFNDTLKKGVIAWLNSIATNNQAPHNVLDWAKNLQKHWDDFCPDGPNEYNKIAKYNRYWGNNKVFLYRTIYINRAQLISSTERRELVYKLCENDQNMNIWYDDDYNREIKLSNGLKIIHIPDDTVSVQHNGIPLDKIGEYQLPIQLTSNNIDDFVQMCREYK